MELLLPELQDLIRKIAKDNGIVKFTVNIGKTVSGDGDGYIGILEGLDVLDKDSDKKLKLVIKKAPTSERLRKIFPTRPTFLREIVMYEEVFPDFKAFQEDHNIVYPFNSVPRFYGSINEEFKELLILENLKEDGYRLCNRIEPLDSHHLSLVLTIYAKLHALSHAMRRLEPDRFKNIATHISEHLFLEFQKNFSTLNDLESMKAMDQLFIPTLEALKDRPELVEALEKTKKMWFEFFAVETMRMSQDELGVISHTDCWSANILFKYEDKSNPSIPTKVTLIDWQMACVTHPVHDVSYFLFISAAKQDLRNYMRYLHVYHTALSDSLSAFGLDPESVYPFELFEEHFGTFSKLGFFMCLVMLQQTLSETKTHDFEKLAEEGGELFIRKSEISDRFRQRMTDLVEFLVENRFL